MTQGIMWKKVLFEILRRFYEMEEYWHLRDIWESLSNWGWEISHKFQEFSEAFGRTKLAMIWEIVENVMRNADIKISSKKLW